MRIKEQETRLTLQEHDDDDDDDEKLFVILRDVYWYMATEFSGQPMGPIFNGNQVPIYRTA